MPYQEPITANRPVYLYTWQLPSAEEVAQLTKVDPECFRFQDQTIGLLFSKPISKVSQPSLLSPLSLEPHDHRY